MLQIESLTSYLSQVSYDARGLIDILKFCIKKRPTKKYPMSVAIGAVAGKQQFNTAQTKIPPSTILEVTGKYSTYLKKM